jgi:predicted nucleic acid-binding protein
LSKYIVDAWAWIEYFRGSEYGAKLNDILEDPTTDVYTCAITVAEVVSKTAREGRDAEAAYDMLLSNAQIIKIDEQTSRQAGLMHAKMRQTKKDFGIADAFVLATASKLRAKIVTGDPHFKDLDNAVMIK